MVRTVFPVNLIQIRSFSERDLKDKAITSKYVCLSLQPMKELW